MAISAVSSRERAKIFWSTSYRVSLRLDSAQLGDGPPVVLLHGLSATKRYVVHRSKALPRAGHRIVAYDARGDGEAAEIGKWDAMADALDEGGIEGFLESWGARDVSERFRAAALENARQRL